MFITSHNTKVMKGTIEFDVILIALLQTMFHSYTNQTLKDIKGIVQYFGKYFFLRVR